MDVKEIIQGAVFGHIIGDALGVPVEFYFREKLKAVPVTDMLGFGSHSVPKGSWSDDSSMMLCSLISIAEKQTLDFEDMMARFSRWVKEGYMTPHGKPFGIGRTCLKAIGRYWCGETAENCGCSTEKDNGNGSLMRVLPIALYSSLFLPDAKEDEKIRNIHTASALTHAHSRSLTACGIYFFVLDELIKNADRVSVVKGLQRAERYYEGEKELDSFSRLLSPNFSYLPEEKINSSGYVVDTLEAAIWCLLNSESYKETVLRAVNLGGDTDTIAAVAGGLAGVLYKAGGLPQEWLNEIIDKDAIALICNSFEGLYAVRSQLKPKEKYGKIKATKIIGEKYETELQKTVQAFG